VHVSGPPAAPPPADTSAETRLVLTFLESVGKRQDAELYLKLFREVPKPSFALVAIDNEILNDAMGLLVDGLQFLSRLDLFPVHVRGFDESAKVESELAEQAMHEFERELSHRELSLVVHSSSADELVAKVVAGIEREHTVCVDFSSSTEHNGLDALASLAVALGTRKLVLLRSRGGLGPKGTSGVPLSKTHILQADDNGIGVINLRTDSEPLLHSDILTTEERLLLEQVATIHQRAPDLVTSVTSPLDLLRELFTVRGAGTLIKTGSSLLRFATYEGLDTARLYTLVQTAFGRKLKPEFTARAPLSVFVECEYRGAAVVEPGIGSDIAYLTKFAVIRSAQGEGLGRELWEAVVRDHPVLYWRARVHNPICSWYAGQCDGMHREEDWWVYWRGVSFERVPELCKDALKRPLDLL
jgi:ribosomal protein S18 acetylase RimI-like enzyme